MLAEILSEEGYVVDVAAHGGEGLDRVRAARPDVVLLDLNMPILDGWGFRDGLRDASGEPPPIIILLTADYNTREKAERIGARAYLTKPFDIDELLDTVSRVA